MVNARAVEWLAQLMYDDRNPLGIPWSQRLPAVRNPWLDEAKNALARLQSPSGPQHKSTGPRKPVETETAILNAFEKHGRGARPLSLGTLIHEASQEPGQVITAIFHLTSRGLMGELVTFSGFTDQPTFRLLPAGMRKMLENKPASDTVPA